MGRGRTVVVCGPCVVYDSAWWKLCAEVGDRKESAVLCWCCLVGQCWMKNVRAEGGLFGEELCYVCDVECRALLGSKCDILCLFSAHTFSVVKEHTTRSTSYQISPPSNTPALNNLLKHHSTASSSASTRDILISVE